MIDIREHLVGVGARAITAENGVECAPVDYGIKSAIIILQSPHVHLLECEVRDYHLAQLLHLLDDRDRDVN